MLYDKCQKCFTKKRKNSKALCTICYNNKNFKLSPILSEKDIKNLKIEILKYKDYLMIDKGGYIDMEDIVKIMEYHHTLFDRDYIGNNIGGDKQIKIMWKDINRFLLMF